MKEGDVTLRASLDNIWESKMRAALLSTDLR
jgi:hypothetical protein